MDASKKKQMLNRKAVKSRTERKISKLHVDVCVMESRIPLGPGKFHVVVLVLSKTFHDNLPVARAKQPGRSMKKTSSCKKETELSG